MHEKVNSMRVVSASSSLRVNLLGLPKCGLGTSPKHVVLLTLLYSHIESQPIPPRTIIVSTQPCQAYPAHLFSNACQASPAIKLSAIALTFYGSSSVSLHLISKIALCSVCITCRMNLYGPISSCLYSR